MSRVLYDIALFFFCGARGPLFVSLLSFGSILYICWPLFFGEMEAGGGHRFFRDGEKRGERGEGLDM